LKTNFILNIFFSRQNWQISFGYERGVSNHKMQKNDKKAKGRTKNFKLNEQ
jgi:hypothetical protein